MEVVISKDAAVWEPCGLNGRKDKLTYNTMVLLTRISLAKLNNIYRLAMGFNTFLARLKPVWIWE